MTLSIQLDPIEARLFGVLIEKALTTPDQYPLSINAATNGANQKSNREPVLSVEEDAVASALYRLEQKYMARKVFPGSGRVERYCHNGKDALGLEIPQLAVLAELLNRGPQTPGELRTRVSRMSPIDSLDHLANILQPLSERGFVRRLPPLPGSRAERYAQLLCPDLHPLEPVAPAYLGAHDDDDAPPAARPALAARVDHLEAQIDRLRRRLEALAAKLGVDLTNE